MGLATVLASFGLVIVTMLAVASLLLIGPDRFRRFRPHGRQRLRIAAPYLVLLLFVLGLNKLARTIGPELSWAIGWNITGLINGLEGNAVAHLQSFATPALTAYFSAVYLYGYGFLLVFPFVAYLVLEESTPLKRTTLAYTFNYAAGLVLYLLLIAYGPRNFMPNQVESLLYTAYPQSRLLTQQVNANTNVFPSLHTSLAVTVALLAWQTREHYPRWAIVAAFLAGSVVVATMYLGIHWVTDVVAGAALAVASVHLARRRTDERESEEADLGMDRTSLWQRSRT